MYLFMGVLIGSAVIPITLCMTWGRVNSIGMICGATGGSILGLTVWLSVASTYDGGLSDFFNNTGTLNSFKRDYLVLGESLLPSRIESGFVGNSSNKVSRYGVRKC